MNNILAFANNKCLTNIHTKLDYFGFAEVFERKLCKRGQKLHFYKNIPADAVIMCDIFHIVAINDIGMPFHIKHKRIFFNNFFEK